MRLSGHSHALASILVLTASMLPACQPDVDGEPAPVGAPLSIDPVCAEVLERAPHWRLMVLNPGIYFLKGYPLPDWYQPAGFVFHKHGVHGLTDVVAREPRRLLARILENEITERDGTMACFQPRHGVRATWNDVTVDLAICFQCMKFQVHRRLGDGPFEYVQTVELDGKPRAQVDAIWAGFDMLLPP